MPDTRPADTATPTWAYAPAAEDRDAVPIDPQQLPVTPSGDDHGPWGWVPTHAPATGEELAQVARASPDVVAAVVHAVAATADRRPVGGTARTALLRRLRDTLATHATELAVLEALDCGTPVTRTHHRTLPAAAATLLHHAGWADKLGAAGLGADPQPVPVSAHLLGRTAPLASFVRSVAPALAAGSRVVALVDPGAALAVLALVRAWRAAGLEEDALAVLPTDAAGRAALAAHDRVGACTVTGPPAAGRAVRAAAPRGRPVWLFPVTPPTVVVLDDAPLDQVVEALVGRVCDGGATVLVQEPVHAALVERLRAALTGVRVGQPLDRNTDLGPLPDHDAVEAVAALVDAATAAGATAWRPGAAVPTGHGRWAAPVLLTDVDPTGPVARTEVDGPVLRVATARTLDEAAATVAVAPAVGVWTTSGHRAAAVAERVRTPVVTIGAADVPVPGTGPRRLDGWEGPAVPSLAPYLRGAS